MSKLTQVEERAVFLIDIKGSCKPLIDSLVRDCVFKKEITHFPKNLPLSIFITTDWKMVYKHIIWFLELTAQLQKDEFKRFQSFPRGLQDVYKGHANILLLQRYNMMAQSSARAAAAHAASRIQPSTPAFPSVAPRTVNPPTPEVDYFDARGLTRGFFQQMKEDTSASNSTPTPTPCTVSNKLTSILDSEEKDATNESSNLSKTNSLIDPLSKRQKLSEARDGIKQKKKVRLVGENAKTLYQQGDAFVMEKMDHMLLEAAKFMDISYYNDRLDGQPQNIMFIGSLNEIQLRGKEGGSSNSVHIVRADRPTVTLLTRAVHDAKRIQQAISECTRSTRTSQDKFNFRPILVEENSTSMAAAVQSYIDYRLKGRKNPPKAPHSQVADEESKETSAIPAVTATESPWGSDFGSV